MEPFPLLLGHRGSRSATSIAENTLPAFENALRHGCDGFEFDVRLTADEEAVVCHNPSSRRLAIAKARRAQLDHLPSFQDVLELFHRRAFLDIELKVRGLEAALLMALSERPPERGYVVSSFLPEVLLDLRARSETVPLGIIFERRVPRWLELPVRYLFPQHSLITQELVRDAHACGKTLIAWTVNDRSTMLRLADWGVDGIISDETELLVRTLRPGLTPSDDLA